MYIYYTIILGIVRFSFKIHSKFLSKKKTCIYDLFFFSSNELFCTTLEAFCVPYATYL